MIRPSVLCFLLVSCAALPIKTVAQDQSHAHLLVKLALAAQGGEQQIRAVRNVDWEAIGYRNELEESERPEGPYTTDFLKVHEVDDFAGKRIRRAVETTDVPLYKSDVTSIMAEGVEMHTERGAFTVGTAESVRFARLRLALNPERLLLSAFDAPDLRAEPNRILQGIEQNVVAFSVEDTPVRVFINAYTHLPTATEYSGPLARARFFAYLGDVTIRTYYSLWWLAKGGIHLPLQWTIEGNGMPDQMLVIRKLSIDSTFDESEFAIPDTIRDRFDANAKPLNLEQLPLGDPAQPSLELEPGVILIPGAWNATIIRQNDGIVILEAPISSGYSTKLLEEARRRFPGLPIKAVISTSDSWPHIAGIRQFVAEGIPIYALDLNKAILDRLILPRRTTVPDELARSPRTAKFNLVTGRTLVGGGLNRLEIFPIRGATSERQLMVYFPEYKLLYGSDPFQKLPGGSYSYPQTVTELTAAVAREHLHVERFFMMHVGLSVWSDLDKAIKTAMSTNSPDGSF